MVKLANIGVVDLFGWMDYVQWSGAAPIVCSDLCMLLTLFLLFGYYSAYFHLPFTLLF